VAADNPRIEELRRRVDKDPASIAFAQLAEEFRRGGDPEEAARICRAGLAHHPNYVSARVTLGRALMELQQLDDAQAEFEQVLLVAPDNLVAVRSMAELYQLKGETPPDMSLAREVATQFAPPPIPVAPPVAAAPPPIPDIPLPVVESPPVPVLETPAPEPEMIEAAPEAPPPMPDLPLQIEQQDGFDTDISLDLDAAFAEHEEAAAAPEPSEPFEPAEPPEPIEPVERPGIDLDAAVAAFNEAFGVPSHVAEPEPETEPEPEPEIEPEPAIELESAIEPEPAHASVAAPEPTPEPDWWAAPAAQPEPQMDIELSAATAAEPTAEKDPFLSDLEEWLAAIKADRDDRQIP
jgi:hypothetical protein